MCPWDYVRMGAWDHVGIAYEPAGMTFASLDNVDTGQCSFYSAVLRPKKPRFLFSPSYFVRFTALA
jgi:hypothetical protein